MRQDERIGAEYRVWRIGGEDAFEDSYQLCYNGNADNLIKYMPKIFYEQSASKNPDELLLEKVEITEEFFRSGGKGGQKVNKTESGVRLRALIRDPEMLARLRQLFPGAVTETGELLIEYTVERSQLQNRSRARQLLLERLRQAIEKPKERTVTQTPATSKRERLEDKNRKARLKKLRKEVNDW